MSKCSLSRSIFQIQRQAHEKTHIGIHFYLPKCYFHKCSSRGYSYKTLISIGFSPHITVLNLLARLTTPEHFDQGLWTDVLLNDFNRVAIVVPASFVLILLLKSRSRYQVNLVIDNVTMWPIYIGQSWFMSVVSLKLKETPSTLQGFQIRLR
jgi:hypothetical protein